MTSGGGRRSVVGGVEGAQLFDRVGLERGGPPGPGPPVSVPGAEDGRSECPLRDPARDVARLQEVGERLLAQPIELLRRKVGTQS
jgi:hypothetical protein